MRSRKVLFLAKIQNGRFWQRKVSSENDQIRIRSFYISLESKLSAHFEFLVKKCLYLSYLSSLAKFRILTQRGINTLTAVGFSESGPFTHLSNHVFRSQ